LRWLTETIETFHQYSATLRHWRLLIPHLSAMVAEHNVRRGEDANQRFFGIGSQRKNLAIPVGAYHDAQEAA